jgi:putative heme-binding domain-containing protein
MKRLLFTTTLLVLLTPAMVYAQQDAKVPDPDPELERKTFIVADGFEVNLFAADPMLAKPIQISFDPQGRLWVASSETYPQIKPGQEARDKILILEDRDGDGVADRTTVFAGGLLIPTGIEPGDGGVYVANSTELVHLSDPNADGKIRRRTVLSGFGTEDTHHMLHSLRWGPDGRLYMNQSIYIHSHIETPHGPRRLNGGGIWQFRTESQKLDVFARGWINAWGHSFDRWGQSFLTDGAGGEGINYVVPGAGYPTAVGMNRILHGLNPGTPKYCGLEILSGRHIPDDWQGNLITNDFRGHRVCRYVLKEDGSGYAAQEKTELIKSNHPAFRPVDMKIGPDGAIYIADWYNPIIQHGEVDFRDPRRDVTHGRIWRVTAKGRPLVKRPQLVKAETPALLDGLKDPEDWTRNQARRVLQERGAKVLPDLAVWVAKLDPADKAFEHHQLEGLWMYQALDTAEPKLLARALDAKDHHARAAAVRVLGDWHARIPDALDLLAKRVIDEHPQVRLEAVRALGEIPQQRAAELAMQVLDRPMDKFLDYALWLSLRDLQPHWLPAVQKGEFDFHGNVKYLAFALQAVGDSSAIQRLVKLFQDGKVPPDRLESVLALIASLGQPQDLRVILDIVLRDAGTGAERQAMLLEALAQAQTQRGAKPAGDLARLGGMLVKTPPAVQAAAARLAGLWKVEALRPQLLDAAKNKDSDATLRLAACNALAALGGDASRKSLGELAGAGPSIALRVPAVRALVGLDLLPAAKLGSELLAEPLSETDTVEIVNAFLAQKGGIALLADALKDRKLPEDVAKVGVRSARASGRDAGLLIDALTKAGQIKTGPRELSGEELRQFLDDVVKKGDAARGEAIYRRKDLNCLKCHAIGGAGGQVGPDMTSIGGSAQVDYLLESLLEPNKKIKEGYHTLVINTKKGNVVTGVKVRQTEKDLILRDAEDREVSVPLNQIDDQTQGKSLMPDGLTDTLTRHELVDLVRFLSELGKLGPYQVSKARLVRRWQVLDATPQAREAVARQGPNTIAGNPSLLWNPGYSTVAGVLPVGELPKIEFRQTLENNTISSSFVRFQLEATTGGAAKLLLNDATGLHLWLDGKPVEANKMLTLDLAQGLHTLTAQIDQKQRREPLRFELDDVSGSPARVQIVGGK